MTQAQGPWLPPPSLGQVGVVLVQLSVPLFTNPVQLIIWVDAIGVKVLIETVVLR